MKMKMILGSLMIENYLSKFRQRMFKKRVMNSLILKMKKIIF